MATEKNEWNEHYYDQWLSMLHSILMERPISSQNIIGVNRGLELTSEWLIQRGFETTVIRNQGEGADILVAKRAPRGLVAEGLNWVGLFGHIDIEECPPSQTSLWESTDPFIPQVCGDRLVSRGIADNLGPLLMRILAFRADDPRSPGILWLIHGEEEIGSPFAHLVYPQLKKELPEMAKIGLWVEETGYFLKTGDQRVLVKDAASNQQLIDNLLGRLRETYGWHNFSGRLILEDRVLNKAFGNDKCPCQTHLLDGLVPYVSFGPNDSFSAIHAPNESLPISYLSLSFSQFRQVIFGLYL